MILSENTTSKQTSRVPLYDLDPSYLLPSSLSLLANPLLPDRLVGDQSLNPIYPSNPPKTLWIPYYYPRNLVDRRAITWLGGNSNFWLDKLIIAGSSAVHICSIDNKFKDGKQSESVGGYLSRVGIRSNAPRVPTRSSCNAGVAINAYFQELTHCEAGRTNLICVIRGIGVVDLNIWSNPARHELSVWEGTIFKPEPGEKSIRRRFGPTSLMIFERLSE